MATPKGAACARARGDDACVMAAGVLWLVPATMLVSSLVVSTSNLIHDVIFVSNIMYARGYVDLEL